MKNNFFFTSEELAERNIVDWGYTDQLLATKKSFYQLLQWKIKGLEQPLGYFERNQLLLRQSISTLFPNAKMAFCFLFDYRKTAKAMQLFYEKERPDFRIASYALSFKGEDYHFYIENSLHSLFEAKKEKLSFNYKIVTDKYPHLDKDLAYRCGLGFFGKNSLLISTLFGSYTLIGCVFVDQDLFPQIKTPLRSTQNDHCGHCRRCIDICPTKAIIEDNRLIDSQLCISSNTIEMRDQFTKSFDLVYQHQDGDQKILEIFGCDLCQTVCPWNSDKKLMLDPQDIHTETLSLKEQFLFKFFFKQSIDKIVELLEKMSNKMYLNFFFKTNFYRLGKKGLLKNFLASVSKNKK